jgi:hypothetical protein
MPKLHTARSRRIGGREYLLVGCGLHSKNGVEYLRFLDGSTAVSWQAAFERKWTNHYELMEALGAFRIRWVEDDFETECEFNATYQEFVEVGNRSDGVWSLIERHANLPG